MQDIHNVLSCILGSYKVVDNSSTLSVTMLFLRTLLELKRASHG